MNNTINTYKPDNVPNDVSNTCINMLPCGVCRLTNQQCPKHYSTTVTWTNTEITCKAKE